MTVKEIQKDKCLKALHNETFADDKLYEGLYYFHLCVTHASFLEISRMQKLKISNPGSVKVPMKL